MNNGVTIIVTANNTKQWYGNDVRFHIAIKNEKTDKIIKEDYWSVQFTKKGGITMNCFEEWEGGHAKAVLEFLELLTGEDWQEVLKQIGARVVELDKETEVRQFEV